MQLPSQSLLIALCFIVGILGHQHGGHNTHKRHHAVARRDDDADAIASSFVFDHGSIPTKKAASSPTPLVPSDDVPIATLLPAVHWDTDTSNISVLHPKEHAKLFYSENGLGNSKYATNIAFLGLNFTSPVIALEHSDHIQDVTCDEVSMNITFNQLKAYKVAIEMWPLSLPIVLISYFPSCGNFTAGQRSYFLSDKILSEDASLLSLRLATQESEITNVVSHLTVDWGAHIPNTTSHLTNANTETVESASKTNTKLPHAKYGPDFDQDLDNALGYISLNNGAFSKDLASIAGGLHDFNSSHYDDPDSLKSRDITKRSWWSAIADAISSVTSAIVDVVETVAAVVTDVVETGAQVIAGAVTLVTGGTVSPSYEKSFTLEVPNPVTVNYVTSTFSDKSLLIKEFSSNSYKASIFCVDCGVTGSTTVGGAIAFSIADGLTKGQLYVNGKLAMTLQVGIEAEFNYTKSFNQRIFAVPLSPFAIPAVITVGPEITLDAELNINIAATGSLLVGVIVDLGSPQATIDFVDSKNSDASGWSPTIKPVLRANGEITIGAELAFPVGIGIGLDVLNGEYSKSIALIDRPAIAAQLQAAAELTNSDGEVTGGFTAVGDCEAGQIEAKLDFTNKLYIDLVGASTVDLLANTVPIAQKCIIVDKKSEKRTTKSVPKINTTLSDGYNFTENPNENNLGLDSAQFSYGLITSQTGKYVVTQGSNGNLYLEIANYESKHINSNGKLFTLFNNVTVGDETARMYHYYQNEMDIFHVSRLRSSALEKIPKTSELITFVPVPLTTNAHTKVLVAADTKSNVFYIVTCTISGQSTRLFLVKDPVAGLKALQRIDLRHKITGGSVTACYHIPYSNLPNK